MPPTCFGFLLGNFEKPSITSSSLFLLCLSITSTRFNKYWILRLLQFTPIWWFFQVVICFHFGNCFVKCRTPWKRFKSLIILLDFPFSEADFAILQKVSQSSPFFIQSLAMQENSCWDKMPKKSCWLYNLLTEPWH